MVEKEKSILPTHIGFIMDGNRRWAKRNKLEDIKGHNFGTKPLLKAVEHCGKLGIKYITVYALSTENLGRSQKELRHLFSLLENEIEKQVPKLKGNGIKLNFIGRLDMFTEEFRTKIRMAEDETKEGKSGILNVALSYGGRSEIVDAVRSILDKKIGKEGITEETVSENIYEAGQPDLDLIVRAGGQQRLSGFMLWQSPYAELYFTDTLWPDFDEVELDKALDYYSQVKRNFGK